MTPKQLAFQTAAQTTIQNLKKRNMEGYFFEDSASCVKAITDLIPDGSIISWGGSETIKECGLMDALQTGNYTLIDRLNDYYHAWKPLCSHLGATAFSL